MGWSGIGHYSQTEIFISVIEKPLKKYFYETINNILLTFVSFSAIQYQLSCDNQHSVFTFARLAGNVEGDQH